MADLFLDYETFSTVDLTKTGAHKYASSPDTEILMLAYAFDDGPVALWQPHLDPVLPAPLRESMPDPATTKHAYNMEFERLITRDVLGVDMPVDSLRCTAVEARYLGFSGGLAKVLEQTGIDAGKDPRGGRLINMFSKPAPANHKATRYDKDSRPAEWQEFCEYCIQDVVVERKLHHWLAQFPQMHDWDWQRYAVDQRINDRGVYVDLGMAQGAIELWKGERANLTEQMAELTGLPKVTRGPVLAWLAEHGVTPDTMSKGELAPLAAAGTTPPEVAEALRLWMQKEQKAVTKYQACIKGADDDSRVRGMFQFKGASRTDRTAGRRIQLQNLKRPIAGSDTCAANLVNATRGANPDLLGMVSGLPVADALGSSIRHCIQAAPGHRLVVCDLASIESVVLGWLSGCQIMNDTFAGGRDTYKVFASRHFGVPYEEVTKEQRTFAKPPVLGAGYMLGWRGLVAYADAMGVSMSDEDAKRAVNTFRTMYKEIPAFWTWIDRAAKYTIQTGKPCEGYRLRVERDAGFLRIQLPSSRNLSYHLPEVSKCVAPWAEAKETHPHLDDQALARAGLVTANDIIENVSYMGAHPKTTAWCRVYAHSGLVTENIVQSIAYDILQDGIVAAERAGLPVVLHVHDEIACEVPEDEALDRPGKPGTLTKLMICMTKRPAWAPDIWLGAEGYVAQYYRKE